MFPYIGHEFVEVLWSLATDKPATDTSRAVSQSPAACEGRDRVAPFRHVTLCVLSRIVAIVRSEWMIYVIIFLIFVCL
jgi:hypothetical protein